MKLLGKIGCCLLCMWMSVSFVFAEETPSSASPEPSESAEPTATPIPGDPENSDYGPAISAASAILVDQDSGTILYQKNIHDTHSPSSLVKLMTVYLASVDIPDNKYITMTDEVFSSFDRTYSHLWIVSGEGLTAKDLEYGAMMSSANDASNMLAVEVSGSVEGFVKKMNSTAVSWGMNETTFTSPHGIEDGLQTSTAYDLAILTRKCSTNASFQAVFGGVSYEIAATNKQEYPRQIATADEMMKSSAYTYEPTTGGKLGSSDEGYVLATTASKNGMNFIVIVMGEETEESAYVDATALFEYGFQNYKRVPINASDIQTQTIEVYDGKKHTGTAVFTMDQNFSALLPIDIDETKLTHEVLVEDEDNVDLIQAYVVFKLDGVQVGKVAMDRDVTVYDTSFNATTLPIIIQVFDTICIVILGLFVLGRVGLFIKDKLQPPE